MGAKYLEERPPFSNSRYPVSQYDLNVDVEREIVAVQCDSGQSGCMCKRQRVIGSFPKGVLWKTIPLSSVL